MNLPETSDLVTFSDSCKNLFAAFVKFAADNSNVEKNKTNPHFKSRYADLASAINGSRDHLAKHELAVMQHPFTRGEYVGVITILCHSSGEFLSSELLLKPIKNDPQAAGSAITYARRYAFMAILNMSAEDDDGNAATQSPKPQHSTPQQQPAVRSTMSPNVPKPAPSPGGFDPTDPAHVTAIEKILDSQKIDSKQLRADILERMTGQPKAALQLIIDELMHVPDNMFEEMPT